MTSSFKSTGLFQGLGKTAKKSSGTPSFRTVLSSLSCGPETPLRATWRKPFNCRANRNQSRRIHPRTLAGTYYVFKGTPGPSPILSWIGRVTCVFTKGSADEIAHYHSFPPQSGGSRFTQKIIKSELPDFWKLLLPCLWPCTARMSKEGQKEWSQTASTEGVSQTGRVIQMHVSDGSQTPMWTTRQEDGSSD